MSAPPQRRVIVASPPELVVHDAPSPCPYLAEQTSRLPLRLPIRRLHRHELDQRLSAGDRRQGLMLYRTACPSCIACEPIRIEVDAFKPGRTQRRVKRQGDRHIETQLGALEPTAEKVALYNKHKRGRGLSSGERLIDFDGYTAFLGESCCDSFELQYRVDGQLIGVAVVDRAETSLSAVYFYFDPDHEPRSPGVYSVLKQVELCQRWGLRYLYLGLYIADCASMAYKRRYLPHQRLLDGRWTTFERPTTGG